MSETLDITPPRARANFLAADDIESRLAQAIDDGSLSNGWLIAGGQGAGKATLAYRLARALLSPERQRGLLEVAQRSQTFSLVASGGHPDLFTAERKFDEKKGRYQADLAIDSVRELTHFMNHTASFGGWRVAIIDTADDLNRHSANALLKVLEEPPPRTTIFVLSAAPGRLLPTIRSRCRRIDLKPLADEAVAGFLVAERATNRKNAEEIARVAGGRPGYALTLAKGAGADAIEAAERFWSAALAGADVSGIAQRLVGKDGDAAWAHFAPMVMKRLAEEARRAALSGERGAGAIVDLRERIDTLFSRGDAVNLDRFQLVLAAARAFKGTPLRVAG